MVELLLSIQEALGSVLSMGQGMGHFMLMRRRRVILIDHLGLKYRLTDTLGMGKDSLKPS